MAIALTVLSIKRVRINPVRLDLLRLKPIDYYQSGRVHKPGDPIRRQLPGQFLR